MRRGADAGRAVGDAAALRLGPGDEALEILDGHVLRRDHGDVGHFPGEGDEQEVALRVVAHVAIGELVDGSVGDRRGAERVAVGRRFRDRVHADVAGSAGAVLHHEGLAEALRKLLGHQAGEHVGRAAGRPGDEDAHGLVGPGAGAALGQGGAGGRGNGGGGGGGEGGGGYEMAAANHLWLDSFGRLRAGNHPRQHEASWRNRQRITAAPSGSVRGRAPVALAVPAEATIRARLMSASPPGSAAAWPPGR